MRIRRRILCVSIAMLLVATAFLGAAKPKAKAPGAEKAKKAQTPKTAETWAVKALVTTPVIRGGQAAQKISVDVTGLKELWLLATVGRDDYHSDRAAWGDPVLIDKAGNRVDMTTLKPVSSTTGWGTLMLNRGLSGGALKIGKTTFKKGFFAHAPSAIRFKIDGKYARFEASVGIGAGAGAKGSSAFRVLDQYDVTDMRNYPKGVAVTVDLGSGSPANVSKSVTVEPNVEAMRRAITDLSATYKDRYPKGADFLKRLDAIVAQDAGEARIKALADLQSEALLANPLLDFDKLLMVRRSGRNLGMPANWQSNSSIGKTGYSNDIVVLSPVSPEGELTTLFKPANNEYVGEIDLHYSADKMLFSMPSAGGKGAWQIHEIQADGTGLRQVSPTRADESYTNNYDACYLPDGRIIFTSTAPCVAVPCVRGGSPVATLFRMNADGSDMRQLCFDQEHSWHPAVMHNGRILYARWEYADLPHANSRMLFSMNPDGTNQRSYYGSNSFWPNSVFYARPVPGHSTKVVGIVSGHHGPRRVGEMIIFDPAKGTQEAEGVVQQIPGWGKKVEATVEDRLTNSSWPKFLTPFPLSEKYYLVSMQPASRANWGVYLVDVFDNMLLLKEQPGFAMLEPVPFRKTSPPPVVPDKVDLTRKDAVVFISDVYYGPGLKGIPKGEVKNLRVFTYTFGYGGVGGLYGSIGMDGPWDMRRTLGTVPVEKDGSAVFRVPANTPIAIQPLDSEGKAMQVMRSWFTAMPGEVLSCTGCHENPNDAPPAGITIASRKGPSKIAPWRGPARNYEYQREVQPVLDKYCVGCHDGKDRTDKRVLPDLRGVMAPKGWTTKMAGNTGAGTGGKFSASYMALHRFVRRPGIESPMPLMTPMEFHADTTELVQMLAKGHHKVKLDAEAWDRLVTWIDFNAPYHGRWSTIVGTSAVAKEAQRAKMRKLYASVEENHEDLPDLNAKTITPIIPTDWDTRPVSPKITLPNWPMKDPAAAVAGKKPLTVELAKGVTLELVYVPAGAFAMGSDTGYVDEAPRTKATIAKGFWMGKFEVTNTQFRAFDPKHDSRFEDRHGYQFGVPGYNVNEPKMPAVRLAWTEAAAFCKWLSTKTGKTVTLPTEAQWEWACRAGTATPFAYGDLDTDFSKHANMGDVMLANFSGNPYVADWRKAKYGNATNRFDNWIPQDSRFNDDGFLSEDVGKYQANVWGLHDMHGNVAEWTQSAYRPYPYKADDGRNAPGATARRVVRGGSWYDRPKRCRSAFRLSYRPYQKVYNVGFRVVIEE